MDDERPHSSDDAPATSLGGPGHELDSVLFAPISVNRRVAIAAQFALKYMSMASIIAWRGTCMDNHMVVTKDLRTSLHILVGRFFPEPRKLLQYLTRWGGLIVGEAALSHVLHDPSICTNVLELAVGNLVYEPFVRRLHRLIPFGTHLDRHVDKPAPASFPFLRHISRISEFYLTSGLVVHVYESSTPAACDVVAGQWTTALMNFVTDSSIGCAYPRLTLNYTGILCDGRVDAKRWQDSATQQHLETKGFQFTPYTPAWNTYSTGPYCTSLPSADGCGRTIYVCPSQGRFFGDPGSLVMFLDGFFVDVDALRESCVAPYGSMAAWRIPTKGTCEGRCAEDRSVLPSFVISIILQFVEETGSNAYNSDDQLRALPVDSFLVAARTRPLARRRSI